MAAQNTQSQALKLRFANEIASCVQEAKSNGAALSDIRHIVTLLGLAAEEFADPVQVGGMHAETAEEFAKKVSEYKHNLLDQLRVIAIFARYVGFDTEKKYHIDALLSFEFERNEQSLSSFFDFYHQKSDTQKIVLLDDLCKQFLRLQIEPAVNVPKFDQTFIDAGRC